MALLRGVIRLYGDDRVSGHHLAYYCPLSHYRYSSIADGVTKHIRVDRCVRVQRGLGGWLLKVANNAHKIAVLHLVLDEVMARPVGRGNDKLIQDILTKLP